MSMRKLIDNIELLYESLQYYYHDDLVDDSISNLKVNYIFKPCSGGINNVVYYLLRSEVSDCSPKGFIEDSILKKDRKYVIRLYNNGMDTNKVIFEHLVLKYLNELAPSFSLNFEFPKPISSKNGDTHVMLSNGIRSAIFHYTDGYLPNLKFVNKLGVACGQTAMVLQRVTSKFTMIELENGPTKPYYDIFRAHHAINRILFFELVQLSKWDSIRSSLDILVKKIVEIEDILKYYHSINLPKQLIHGDLHFDNILCNDVGVTAVLDFEFVAFDWRPMELAICLSKYASEADAMSYFNDFIHGYATVAKLTQDEIMSLPDLMLLRILNNVVYFVSRENAGEDSTKSLLDRSDVYCKRMNWIHDNKDEIINMLLFYFRKYDNLI